MRVIDQGPGDGDALALAAGQFVGLVVGPRFQADGFQLFHGPFRPFPAADTGVDQGQGDIVQGGDAGQEVEVLEDEANVLVADDGQFIVAEVGDFLAAELIRTRRRPVQAAQDVHERRFS